MDAILTGCVACQNVPVTAREAFSFVQIADNHPLIPDPPAGIAVGVVMSTPSWAAPEGNGRLAALTGTAEALSSAFVNPPVSTVPETGTGVARNSVSVKG